MIIIAFDPGESTGVAIYDTDERQVLDTCVLKYPRNLYTYLGNASVLLGQGAIVVVEQYLLYGHLAQAQSWSKLIPVRVIGAIEYATWLAGIDVVFQTASQAKQLCSRGRLEDYGWWKGFSVHERDALRHIATYLIRREMFDRLPAPVLADADGLGGCNNG